MIQSLIGKIRLPRKVNLSLTCEDNVTKFSLDAHQDGREPLHFERTYQGELLSAQSILDLLSWLKYSAKQFFGSESGGL
jgi:hypothetical protein